MIKYLAVENFHSYLERKVVDFTVDKKTASSYFDWEYQNGDKINKVACFLGPNGAGKSNILKALAFISWFISNSFESSKPEDDIPIVPHFSAKDQDTKFEVGFTLQNPYIKKSDHLDYKYIIKLKNDNVLLEELYIKNIKTGSYKKVISRNCINGIDTYKVNLFNKESSLNIKSLEQCPKNCSLLSFIRNISSNNKSKFEDGFGIGAINSITRYFGITASNISMGGRNDFDIDRVIRILETDKEIFQTVKSLITSYDIGITDIEIREIPVISEKSGDIKNKKVAFFTHKHNGDEYSLPSWLESNGTQSAFCVITIIATQLRIGGVAILDEFDNDLHPFLTIEILDLFKNEYHYKEDAQLFFTSHTPQILNSIRKQHCFLVEKFNSESDIYRIDDIGGIRERDNLYSKYMAGILGGTPEFI